MSEKKRKGNITKLTDENTLDIKGSINMLDFGDGGTQRQDDIRMRLNTQPIPEKDDNKKNKGLGEEYIDDQEDEKETMTSNIIKNKKNKLNTKKKNGLKQSGMVFPPEDKYNSWFERQMIAEIKAQQKTKTKATEPKFKFNKFGSISSDTYVPNNLSQRMRMFPNNNKAEKGTDKTMKFDFKKGK